MDISETGLERPISENMAGYFITNRWSNESRDRACSGYAKSRQRKTIVNRETLLSDIMSGSLAKSSCPCLPEKIWRMYQIAQDNGFTSFAEAKDKIQ